MTSTQTRSSFFDSFMDGAWKTQSRRLRQKLRERRSSHKERNVLIGIQSSSDTTVAESIVVEPKSEEPMVQSTRVAQRALTVARKGEYELVDAHPFPELHHEEEVVIHNYATGLNPIDWKSVDFNFCMPEFPWINGREMAGVVEKVGSEVKDFKVGDRVWTSTYYRDRRAGCFQEFVTVPQHTVAHIPAGMSFEEAACLGVAALTSAMTLWKWLDVSRPSSIPTPPASPGHEEYLLVWGGSAVTGQFAIQLGRLGGLKVIAVSSEKARSRAEQLGANHVIVRDGKTNEQILGEIRQLGGDNITRAVDVVGPKTAAFAIQALSKSSPSKFAPLAMMSSSQEVPPTVEVQNVEMKRFVLDPSSQVYAEDLNRLLESGQLQLPQLEVLNGGLDAVPEGLTRLKQGNMEGKKLIVSMRK